MNGTVYRILSRTKCIINGTVYHCPGHSAGLIEIIISQITHCRIMSSMCSHLAKDWTQLSGLPLTGFKLSIFFKKYHMYSIYHINIKGVYSRIRNIKSKNNFWRIHKFCNLIRIRFYRTSTSKKRNFFLQTS